MARLPYLYIARQFAKGDQGSAAEKGVALENIVVRTFAKIPGIDRRHVWRNKRNAAGSDEIDILLYNWPHRQGLPFAGYFLVECKNWKDRVDSSTLRTFVDKIRSRHLKVGILVAANGITGDRNGLPAAKDIVRSAFLLDEIIVLVITRAELEALRTVEDLVALLWEKHAELLGGVGLLISDPNDRRPQGQKRKQKRRQP